MRPALAAFALLVISAQVEGHIPSPRTAEDHVYFSTVLHAKCEAAHPALKSELNKAFGVFRSRNRAYFAKALESNPDFVKNTFMLEHALEDLEMSHADCKKLIGSFLSPESDLSGLPQ